MVSCNSWPFTGTIHSVDGSSMVWLLFSLHVVPNNSIFIRCQTSMISRARLPTQFCRSGLTVLLSLTFSSDTGQCLSSSPIQGKEWGKGDLLSPYSSPAKEQSRQELCTHGLGEHPREVTVLGHSCPGRWEGALPSPPGYQHISQLFPPPTLTSQVRSDQLWGWDRVHERQTSSCGALFFSLAVCPEGYFYQEKFTQCSCSSVGASQWYRWRVQRLPTRLPGLSKWALPIFIHCMSLEQTEDIKCFVLAQAEGEKKKLHLIDRSLGFWSRSCVWLQRRWHSSSGRVVKGHLLANCLFGLLRAASWKTEEMRIRGIPADRKTSNCTL